MQTVTITVRVIFLAACAWLATNPVAGEQPEQKQAVEIPLSSISRMATGFEFREPWNPYWKIRDESQHALVGRFLRTREKSTDDRFGATEFEIIAVYNSRNELCSKGQIIAFPWRIDGERGDIYGLCTSTHQSDYWQVPEEIDDFPVALWLVPEKIDETISAHLAAIPVDDSAERLRYFFA